MPDFYTGDLAVLNNAHVAQQGADTADTVARLNYLVSLGKQVADQQATASRERIAGRQYQSQDYATDAQGRIAMGDQGLRLHLGDQTDQTARQGLTTQENIARLQEQGRAAQAAASGAQQLKVIGLENQGKLDVATLMKNAQEGNINPQVLSALLNEHAQQTAIENQKLVDRAKELNQGISRGTSINPFSDNKLWFRGDAENARESKVLQSLINQEPGGKDKYRIDVGDGSIAPQVVPNPSYVSPEGLTRAQIIATSTKRAPGQVVPAGMPTGIPVASPQPVSNDGVPPILNLLSTDQLGGNSGQNVPMLFNLGGVSSNPTLNQSNFGNRQDGTQKGNGFLGVLKRPDGGVSTELSIGVNIGGKETEIPSLVPTLTKSEIDHLLSGGQPTREIVQKAVNHANMRISAGKSPFAGPNDSLSSGQAPAPAANGELVAVLGPDGKHYSIARSRLAFLPPGYKEDPEFGK